MSNVIKISVVIPVYNSAPYLQACLDSLLSQSLREFEIICVDDASTDGSGDILHSYASQYEAVRIITLESNKGAGNARNTGVYCARGEYIWFVDSDDSINDGDALKKLYITARNDDLDILLFDSEYFYENEELRERFSWINTIRDKASTTPCVSGEELFSYQIKNNEFLCCPPLFLIKRSFLGKNDLKYDFGIHEDLLFAPLALVMANKAKYINEKYYVYYRRNHSVTTNSNDPKRVSAYAFVIWELLRWIEKIELKKETLLALSGYINSLKDTMMNYYLASLMSDNEVVFQNNSIRLFFYALLEMKYPLISEKISHELITRLNNSTSIIVYGAGRVSCSVQELLSNMKIEHYCIAVSKGNKEGEFLLSDLVYLKDDSLLLVASKNYCEEMSEYAFELGFMNQYRMA